MKSSPVTPPRTFRNPQLLWDNPDTASLSLGCWGCVDRDSCGGAHKGGSFFDCSDYCRCADKSTCDLVCRGNPAAFVARVREVGGLKLMDSPRGPRVTVDPLPAMVPLIEHRSARSGRLNFPIVAVPLYTLIDLSRGTLKFRDREALATQFGIDPAARLVVSGVARDRKIERYWELANRKAMLDELCSLDVSLITPPNFSVLTDVPRYDNLHAMKRILLTCMEMANAGLPVALHLNARTEQDYRSWTQLLAARPEIECVAFEFATGAGRGSRIDWHVAQLCELAANVGRDLRLIARGGVRVLEPLRLAFNDVTMIDTDAFNKTRCRRQAYFTEAGRLLWRSYPTASGAPLDDLLEHNIATLHSHHTYLERLHADRRLSSGGQRLAVAKYGNRKSIQGCYLR
ncbi:DUF4417 domain-containing protein [Sphingomonas sp. SORGH_AS_0438]|uniref:DUF4417 domain-containing protein n=1 Tax=Sphingomonas sp. SORGH_AS_0438 TaxID=3041756 RepID=UPI00285C3D33|nr:DUF4417 domain-containing protein [Sphingomonas sp. SORGH_AS_0438]MDR6129091.1 hypothetical protein [Sphingomonas sp. SORGH_AS_0438]